MNQEALVCFNAGFIYASLSPYLTFTDCSPRIIHFERLHRNQDTVPAIGQVIMKCGSSFGLKGSRFALGSLLDQEDTRHLCEPQL